MSAVRQTPLRDVATIERNIIEPAQIVSGTNYVGLENIESGGRFVGVRPVHNGELASSKFEFTSRHVLYGKLRPYLAKIARPEFKGICSTDLLPIRPGPDVDRDYLAWMLLSPALIAFASSRATGANLPRLSPHALGEMRIPLPPLPEQRRIADILDKADALRAKRRAALKKFDELTQSIFLDMFGDPATNPKGWPQALIGKHATKIGSGATPRGGKGAYKLAGTTLIRSMNVRDGVFLRDGLAFIDDEQAAQLDSVVVEAGDVLLNITGASVARVCRAPADVLPARVNQHVAIIRPAATFNPLFLEQCLLFPSMKRRLLEIARAGATREAITKSAIERFTIIRPPRKVQDQFAALAHASERTHRQMSTAFNETDMLFGALQHRAFRGEM
ncbi:MAG TPA: restriction endonuclease subunit S [Gammaproteobacteria bacterium]|nr:restriction endonuclease subunit S [Gammaproteobacteria bacterium]